MRFSLTVLAILFFTLCRAQTVIKEIDVVPGPLRSSPSYLHATADHLYFYALDSGRVTRLWYVDKNDIPRKLFNDNIAVSNDTASSYAAGADGRQLIAEINGVLYFSAVDPNYGNELFKYDFINPPMRISDINTGACDAKPTWFQVINNKLYFVANTTNDSTQDIYEYSPATSALNRVTWLSYNQKFSYIYQMVIYNNKLAFIAENENEGLEVWQYDPTTNSSTTLTSWNPSFGYSYWYRSILELQVNEGKLYVMKNQSYICLYSGLSRIWVSLHNLSTLPNDIGSTTYTFFQNNIYTLKSGYTPKFTRPYNALYKFDTTTKQPATQVDATIAMYPWTSGTGVVFNNHLFFAAARDKIPNPYASAIYKYNGVHPPEMIFGSNPNYSYDYPLQLTVFNDALYFTSGDAATGAELYKYSDAKLTVQNLAFTDTVVLYPNPTRNTTTLEINLKETQTFSISLTDIQGREVYTIPAKEYAAIKNNITIPTQSLSIGTYFYRRRQCKILGCTDDR